MKVAGTIGLALAVVVVGFSAAATAQQPTSAPKPKVVVEPARPIQSVEGKDLFAAYCASCHGKGAKGDGPAAAALKTPPPDLTMLAKKNGGKYNFVEVEQMISGTGRSMSAHGSGDMPIWGHIFYSMSKDSALETMRTKNLVKFLEGIQAK